MMVRGMLKMKIIKSKQKAFDLWWEHYIVNNGSLSGVHGKDGSFCRYRRNKKADCKARCAVGLLIPDEKYDPEMDNVDSDFTGLTVEVLYNNGMFKGFGWSRKFVEFLTDAQIRLHDNFFTNKASKHDKIDAFVDFAGEHKLKIPKIT